MPATARGRAGHWVGAFGATNRHVNKKLLGAPDICYALGSVLTITSQTEWKYLMANIKSQKKRIGTNELARQRNASMRSRMRTLIKNALSAIEAKDAEKTAPTVKAALSAIDRAVTKGVIHRNAAARKKSMLQTRAAV